MSNPGGVNLNIGPYFDDYDEDKKYVRVLYRPGRAVQARELTQAQTYQQKQIQRFAEYFFSEGSIVDGCEQSLDLRMEYVKLQPEFVSVEVDVNDFLGKRIVGANTGCRAYAGLVSDAEGNDPKTLFINYESTGSVILTVDATGAYITLGNTITFNSGNTGVIRAFYQDQQTSQYKVYVSDLVGGPDTLPFTANSVGSDGNIFTMNVGEVSDKRTSTKFENSEKLFVLFDDIADSPNTSYANTATSRATFTIVDEGLASQETFNYGSKYTINDGTIYVADHFVKHDSQTIILDKYTNRPSYKVGVIPTKSFIDTVDDQTLLDNAQGTPNFQALGADRLKIDTVLAKVPINEVTDESEFVPITEVIGGNVVKKFTEQVESKLEDALAKRTFEESGNYTLSDPRIFIREHLRIDDNGGKFTTTDGGNNQLLVIETDPFVSYVKGFRNELLTKIFTPVRKGTDTQFVEQVKTSVLVGSYIPVKELVGTWDFMESTKIDLYDTAQRAISNNSFSSTTLTGSKIGEARVRAVEYSSGTVGTASAEYNLYIYDIVMSANKLFQNVRGFYQAGSSLPNKFADVVVDTLGNATLKESAFESSIFKLPYVGIKTLRDENNNVESGFQFRKEFPANFNGTGQVTLATTDLNETFSSGGTEALKNINYIVVPTNTANTGALTGTANVSSGGTIVSSLPAATTSFSTQFQVGDVIRVGTQDRVISSITNNFYLTVASSFTSSATSNAIYKVFPAGKPIKLSGIGSTGVDRTVTVGSPPQTVVIDLKESGLITSFGSGFAARVSVIMDRANAREIRKTLVANREVQINPNTHPNGRVGPYELGYGDVYQIRAVYQSSGFGVTATSSNTNVTTSYTLDNGQRDTSYEHGSIRPNIGINPTGNLLVVFDHFTHDTSQGIGYLSFDSYPVNDTVTSNTTIRTEDVPSYRSTRTGELFNLRDCIDFRPIKVANTTATNPINTGLYQIPTGGLHFPTPASDFDADLIYYKGRKAKLIIDETGSLLINDGSPGYPLSSPPPTIPDTLELAEVTIPVYPSLAKDIRLESYSNRRFTMREIGKMNKRIEQIEYYATLSELEKQAQSKIEVDDDGFDRFKNGILVDSFRGHNIHDVFNPDGRQVRIDTRGNYATSHGNNEVSIELAINEASSSNIKVAPGRKVYVNYTEQDFINQPYASKTINLAQELTFNWTGDMTIVPATDNWVDVKTVPEANSVVDLTGITDNFKAITDSWNTVVAPHLRHWVGETPTTTSTTTSGASRSGALVTEYRDTRTVTTQNQTLNEIQANFTLGQEVVNQVTQRVADISIKHFIRPREFVFVVQGLKDGAQLYAFFDGENVTANCTQINLVGSTDVNSLFNLFDTNGNLAADASKYTLGTAGQLTVKNNRIIGKFKVPEGRFYVGQRSFRVTDSPTDDVNESTTIATSSIFAQGTSITKGYDVVSTRPFEFKGFANQPLRGDGTTRRVTLKDETTRTITRQWYDPLSQSFYVDEETYPEGVYVTSLDLFFKTKAPDTAKKGVTCEIREMLNGFPTRTVIEKCRVEHDSINLSNDSTANTTFVFQNPAYLPPGVEYCWVAIPDGSVTDFNVFVAELGQFDITNPEVNFRITEQPATGMLFTSANDFTWIPRQNQDVKFKLRTARFSTSPATVVLQNKPWANTGGNFDYSVYSLNIENLTTPKSSIVFEGRTADASYTLSTFNGVKNLERIQLSALQQLANSTNESTNLSTSKSITVRATMRTENSNTSPYIDLERMRVYLEQNIINNKTSNQLTGTVSFTTSNNIVAGVGTLFDSEIDVGEYALFGEEYRQVSFVANNNYLEVKNNFTTNGSGATAVSKAAENPSGPYADTSRYITRVVELNDGFESSDLAVYLAVNRPPGTDIKVYYKVLSDSDTDPFDTKFYNEMTLDGLSVTNQDSTTYNEEKYIVPASKKTGGSRLLSGNVAITTSSTNVVGTGTVFLEQLQVGAEIAVGTSRLQRRIASIVNNTFLTVETAYATTASEQEIYRILNNSIGYTTPDGRSFSGYKYFAIKVVFLSTNTAVAPKIKDLRVIALA